MSKRQGRSGELFFSLLCTDEGAVCNESHDDQNGWDHIIEIEQAKVKNLPADLQAGLLQSFVQIKTTRGIRLTTNLKLSNALKATKSDLPFFIFLLKYNKSNSNPEIYGRHIWKADFYKFLKRAREIEEGGEQDVRKIKVGMSFSVDDKIDISLTKWMLQHFQEIGGDYATTKKKLVNGLGYEKTPIKIEIKFGDLTSPDDIIDHQIGLIKDLPVTDFKAIDNRFGISSKLPVHQSYNGRISFQAKPISMVLELSHFEEGSVQLPVQAFASTLLNVSDKGFKFRVVAGHFEIIYEVKSQKVRLNHCYDPYAEMSIMQHIAYAFLKKCSEKGGVSLSLTTEEGEFFTGSLNLPIDTEKWIKATMLVGKFLIDNVGSDKCNQVNLSLIDFFESVKKLHLLAELVDTNSFQLSADFEGKVGEFSVLVGYIYEQIGQWSIGVLCSFELTSNEIKGKIESFSFSKLKIVKKSVFNMPIEQMKQHMAGELEKYTTSMNIKYAIIEFGDLIECFRKAEEKAPILFNVSD